MDFQKYIPVRRSANNFECLEVPLEPDNTLSIHTLRAAFPRAHGLKFQASAFGGWRTLRADEFKLFAPADGGWRNNVPFFVIFDEPNEPKKAPITSNGTAEATFLPKPKEVTFGPVNGTGTSNIIPIPNNNDNNGIANNAIPAPKVPEKLYNSAPNPTADRRFVPCRNFRGRFKQQARKSCGGFIPQRPLCIKSEIKSETNNEKNEPKIKRAAALSAQMAMKGKK